MEPEDVEVRLPVINPEIYKETTGRFLTRNGPNIHSYPKTDIIADIIMKLRLLADELERK